MSEYVHWCGNCQIRIYIERHYGKRLSWEDCPYVCKYKTAMSCSIHDDYNKEKTELDLFGDSKTEGVKDGT